MSNLNSLIDRLAIEDLFARYAHNADSFDAEGWVNCFSPDGVFEVKTDGAGIQFIGRAELYEFIFAHIRLLPGTRHIMANHLVEISGNRAHHRCSLTGMLSRPEKVYTFISGWYESTLEKVDSDWKIKHRIIHGDNTENRTERELVAYLQPFVDWMAKNGTPS